MGRSLPSTQLSKKKIIKKKMCKETVRGTKVTANGTKEADSEAYRIYFLLTKIPLWH